LIWWKECLDGNASIIVPEEFNVLINPQHPDARRLKATMLRLWRYDPRLF
jgi:hypothetical protein